MARQSREAKGQDEAQLQTFVAKTSSVSLMQQGMRRVFVRAIHKALRTGYLKSKVL